MNMLMKILKGVRDVDTLELNRFKHSLREVLNNVSKGGLRIYDIHLPDHQIPVFEIIADVLGFGFHHVCEGSCTYSASASHLIAYESKR